MPRNSSSRPACRCSAPQHPCPRGATTSQPAAARQPDRRRVHVGIEEALDAAGEEPDAATRRVPRARRDLGQRRHPGGNHRQAAPPSTRRRSNGPSTPSDRTNPLKARSLVEAQRAEHGRRAEPGEERRLSAKPRVAVVRVGRAHALAGELAARGLEEVAEGHARGAGRLAGAAAEAEVEMARERRRQLGASLGGGAHEVDAAARRVHLLAEHAERRALRQADTAVHAGPKPIHGRRVLGGRIAPTAVPVRHGHHSPPTKRPGLRTTSGSNSSLEPPHDRERIWLDRTPHVDVRLDRGGRALDDHAAPFAGQLLAQRMHEGVRELSARRHAVQRQMEHAIARLPHGRDLDARSRAPATSARSSQAMIRRGSPASFSTTGAVERPPARATPAAPAARRRRPHGGPARRAPRPAPPPLPRRSRSRRGSPGPHRPLRMRGRRER